MIALLAFGVLLLAAVLLSELAEQSVFSLSVLFLVGGVVVGMTGLLAIPPQEPALGQVFELALFAVLFTDGMHFSLDELRATWRLPGRALLFGMPLTLLAITVLAHWLVGLTWMQSLLVGSVLSPTDPVFAAAIVRRPEVPSRLRQLLNVESGLNDGLALPAVLLTLHVLEHTEEPLLPVLGDLAMGFLLGAAVAFLAVTIVRYSRFSPSGSLKPLYGLAIAVVIYALAQLFHGNLFLAGFAGGVTVATAGPAIAAAFQPFGALAGEVLKLAALLVFGSLISIDLLVTTPWTVYLFAILTLIAARPIVIAVVLLGSELSWQERAVAAWFGPKGFASIFYGLLIVQAQIPSGLYLAQILAVTIAISIIVHSSTDVIVARWLKGQLAPHEPAPPGQANAAE